MRGRHLYPLAWVTMVLLLFASSANAQTFSGLISEWKADGNTLDSVGGNNASIVGTVGFTPGQSGSAFNFDGSSSYLAVDDAPNLRPDQVSIEAWIKPNFAGRPFQGADVDTIVERQDFGYILFVNQTAGFVYGGSSVGSPQGAVGLQLVINGVLYAAYSSTVIPNDGKYHHIAGTFDGYTARVYIDGVSTATTIVALSGAPGRLTYSPGQQTYFGLANPPFRPAKAAIDDIKIFGRGLTADEVNADAHPSAAPPTQFTTYIGSWANLNEGDATKAHVLGLPTFGVYDGVALTNDAPNFHQFMIDSGFPAVSLNFDGIALQAGQEAAAPASFDLGNGYAASIASLTGNTLSIVRGGDTVTDPTEYGGGVPDPDTNWLEPTSGLNVLSPGGLRLAAGPEIHQSDSVTIQFNKPVQAVGFDLLFQSDDVAPFVFVNVYDNQGNLLYSSGQHYGFGLPAPNLPGGAPHGNTFVGFVSPTANISRIDVIDIDENNVNPDCNIGFDSFRIVPVIGAQGAPKPVVTGGFPTDGAGNILIGGIYGPVKPGVPTMPGQVTHHISGTGVRGATITITVKDPLHANSGDNFTHAPIIVGDDGTWSGDLTLFDCDPEVDITQTVGGGTSDPVIWSGPVDGTAPTFLNGGPSDGIDFVGGGGNADIHLVGGAGDTGSFVHGDAVGYEWRLYDGSDYGSYVVVGGGGDTLDYVAGPGDYYFELAATDSAGNVLIGRCHHTVKKNPCSIIVDNTSIYWNETGNLTGKVLDGMGGAIPGATLTFSVNGADAGSGAGYHATADAGTYTITGSFAGNAVYDAATGTGSLKIVARPTAITGTDVIGAPGAIVTLPGALGDVRLNGAPAPGTLTWKVGGQPAANPYTVGLAPGVYPVDVDFPGDKHYAPSHNTFKLTVPTPPSIINCGVGNDSLWPPNHDLVNVNLNYTVVPGTYPIAKTSVVVYSNEPDLGPDGDDNFSPDAKGSLPGTLRLRSERDGQSAGRVYLVVITATDTMGNQAVCCHATVTVPHDQSKASKDQVASIAATAAAYAEAHNGTPPAGYVKVGDGPVIGPKQ